MKNFLKRSTIRCIFLLITVLGVFHWIDIHRVIYPSLPGAGNSSFSLERSMPTAATGKNNILSAPPNSSPLNITDKSICFIHVGKTGGSSFAAQFAEGEKIVHNPKSLPSLRTWSEIHTYKRSDYTNCDYFIAWVRDPIERGVSAYNMVFDPAQQIGAIGRWLRIKQRELERFGDLNNLTEQLLTNPDALMLWRSIEHVKLDIFWYFSSDDNGNAVAPGQMAHSHTLSRLAGPQFVRKLVFVGANECYNEDVHRFATLFGVQDSFMDSHPTVHERKKHANSFDSRNLSPEARNNLHAYFKLDYDILQSLSLLDLIKCQKLNNLIWR